MDFKEFYFNEEDEAEMFAFVAQHQVIFIVIEDDDERATEYNQQRGWIVRVKFDNSPNNK
jgi:hypothetical protein